MSPRSLRTARKHRSKPTVCENDSRELSMDGHWACHDFSCEALGSVVRPCQSAVVIAPAGDDGLELGGETLVKHQELRMVGAGAGIIAHGGEQHAAIHVGLREIGLELE